MKNKITRNAMLEELRDQLWNNVFSYSGNYAMTRPKEGDAGEWETALAKAELMDQIVAELPAVSQRFNQIIQEYEYIRRSKGNVCSYDGSSKMIDIAISGVGCGHNDRETRLLQVHPELLERFDSGVFLEEYYERESAGLPTIMTFDADCFNRVVAMEWQDKQGGDLIEARKTPYEAAENAAAQV